MYNFEMRVDFLFFVCTYLTEYMWLPNWLKSIPTLIKLIKITTAWIQISRQNLNGFFTNASYQIMI
jgi:hypothetical protein